jgi:molecular chaperone GrpE
MKSGDGEQQRSSVEEVESGEDGMGHDPADVVEDQPDGSSRAEGEGEAEQPVGGGGGSAELEELRERYLRLAAEYDNYRKRTDRERSESRERAQAQFAERLLDPIDDLQRVAQFSADATSVDALLEGVRMVERKMTRLLEGIGVEMIDARGSRFDPEVHEAVMMTPTDDPAEDDTVAEVFQAGYRLRGVLLRPARVQVRKHGG